MSEGAEASRNEKREPRLQGLRGSKAGRAGKYLSGTKPQPGGLRAQQGPAPGPEVRGQAKGAVSWEEPIPPSLHFSKSNQQSERGKKTDYLAVYLADRQG